MFYLEMCPSLTVLILIVKKNPHHQTKILWLALIYFLLSSEIKIVHICQLALDCT